MKPQFKSPDSQSSEEYLLLITLTYLYMSGRNLKILIRFNGHPYKHHIMYILLYSKNIHFLLEVVVGDLCSSCLDIACGIPQRSVMGPKFGYSVYQWLTQGIKKHWNWYHLRMIPISFFSGRDLKTLIQVINMELSKL